MTNYERTYLIQTYASDFKILARQAKDLKEKWTEGTYLGMNLCEERLRVILNLMWTFGIIKYDGWCEMTHAVHKVTYSAL